MSLFVVSSREGSCRFWDQYHNPSNATTRLKVKSYFNLERFSQASSASRFWCQWVKMRASLMSAMSLSEKIFCSRFTFSVSPSPATLELKHLLENFTRKSERKFHSPEYTDNKASDIWTCPILGALKLLVRCPMHMLETVVPPSGRSWGHVLAFDLHTL